MVEENAVSQLKHDELSWPNVENVWKKTSVYRLTALKKSNFSPTDVKETWPHFLKPLGYKLVS